MTRKWIMAIAAVALAFALSLPAWAEGQQQAPTAPAEKVKIRILPQCDAPVDEDSPLIEDLEKKLDVNFVFIYLERAKKNDLLNLRLAAGDIPDVFQGYPDDRFREFIRQGVLRTVPLAKVEKELPTYVQQVRKYGGANIINFGKSDDGNLYGLPNLSYNGQWSYTPIWRDDWLKNVGITTIPATLAEAEKAFYAFVNNDPDKNGKKDTYALSDRGLVAVFGAFGGLPPYTTGRTINWTLVDGKINASITTPGTKDALKLLGKWYKDGLIDPEWITGENKGQYWGNVVTFWNGLIGFSVPGMFYHIGSPEEQGNVDGSNNWKGFKSLQPNGTYAPGPPPKGPTGKSGVTRWGTIEGSYTVFGKNMSEAQLTKWFQISERMCTDEPLRLEVWNGLPEVHWTRDAGGKITNKLSSIEAGARLGVGSNGIGGWTLDLNIWDARPKPEQPMFIYADKVGKFDNGYPNLVWGSLPSGPTYKQAVEKMAIEYYTQFITGAKDVDKEWDAFTTAINKAGLEILTKEAQTWYEKFNK